MFFCLFDRSALLRISAVLVVQQSNKLSFYLLKQRQAGIHLFIMSPAMWSVTITFPNGVLKN